MVGRNVYVEQSQTLGVSPKYDRVTKEQLSMTQKKKKKNENVRSGILHNPDVTLFKFPSKRQIMTAKHGTSEFSIVALGSRPLLPCLIDFAQVRMCCLSPVSMLK